MAGIFGEWRTGPGDEPERASAMAEALKHRGHTDPEILRAPGLVLGVRSHRRPRRHDHQPGSRLLVVLDGYVLNRAELLDELGEHRIDPTASDPAIIAAAYRQFGADAFSKFRGPFAVALWDGEKQRLLLARDHLGHKPLFYARTADGFAFASEQKALTQSGAVAFDVDAQALSHFLSLRFLPAPHTLVKGIRKVPPATVVTLHDAQVTDHRFWRPSFADKLQASESELIDRLDEQVHEVVRLYAQPHDHPGSFLSAGLDSGLIAANLARSGHAPFDTFTLGVANDSDEAPGARLVSQRYGTRQHEFYPDEDLVRLLPAMIWHLDEPSDMVVISKYLISRMAGEHVDAALSGDGGDELFAGFHRYLGIRDAQFFALIPNVLLRSVVKPVARMLGGQRGLSSLPGKLLWMSEIAAAGSLGQRYGAAVEYLRFTEAQKRELLAGSWSSVPRDSKSLLDDLVTESDAEHPVEKLLYTDFLTRLPEHLLMLDDRTGWAHGIEVMCPFADRSLVELSGQIPFDMKIRGRQSKYIERQLARRHLPDEVINLAKTGWSFPFSALCAGPLNAAFRRVFRESALARDGIMNATVMERLAEQHASRQADHHVRIWMLLSLEIWYRMAKDGLSVEDTQSWLGEALQTPRTP